MTRPVRHRRRRFLVNRFQYRLLSITAAYLLVIALVVGAVVVVPLAGPLHPAAATDARSASVARGILWLHERLWPVLLPTMAAILAHSVLVSHRIAGPLVRIRAVLGSVGAGDLTVRARLRTKDYLWDEARALDAAVDGLGERLREVADRAASVAERAAELAARGELRGPASEALAQELAALQVALGRFRLPEPAGGGPPAEERRAA